jgi:hypothetical protein
LQIDIDSDESKEHQAILLAARPLLQRHMKQWREIKREEAKNNGPEVLLERDASLFDFWRSCRANFALLSIATFIPVASRYLGIPATSAPSERSFSSSGLAVTKLRNRLGMIYLSIFSFAVTGYFSRVTPLMTQLKPLKTPLQMKRTIKFGLQCE